MTEMSLSAVPSSVPGGRRRARRECGDQPPGPRSLPRL